MPQKWGWQMPGWHIYYHLYNLDRIDNDADDDDENDNRLTLSSVLPNASLCLDCGAYEDCTDTICIHQNLLYFYMYWLHWLQSRTYTPCITCTCVTLFVISRTYSSSTCTTCTACKVELAHLAQLELVLIVAPTRIAVTLFVIHWLMEPARSAYFNMMMARMWWWWKVKVTFI